MNNLLIVRSFNTSSFFKENRCSTNLWFIWKNLVKGCIQLQFCGTFSLFLHFTSLQVKCKQLIGNVIILQFIHRNLKCEIWQKSNITYIKCYENVKFNILIDLLKMSVNSHFDENPSLNNEHLLRLIEKVLITTYRIQLSSTSTFIGPHVENNCFYIYTMQYFSQLCKIEQ